MSKNKKILTDVSGKQKANTSLVDRKRFKFKITIAEKLDNNFCFKSLTSRSHTNAFQKFIDDTVLKGLTISQMDKLYLRTKGNVKEEINGREVIHYGKKRSPFRLFGYYNVDSYFVITRIDPNHKTHK